MGNLHGEDILSVIFGKFKGNGSCLLTGMEYCVTYDGQSKTPIFHFSFLNFDDFVTALAKFLPKMLWKETHFHNGYQKF